MTRSAALLGTLLLAACDQASGVVVDAGTGKPIAGAVLTTSNAHWGFRDGDLVWDKEYVSTARSGADGRFRFDVGGGTGLKVSAAGYPAIETSFCSRDTRILLGGPYPALKADRRLVFAERFGPDDRDPAFPPALAKDFGVTSSDWSFDGEPVMTIAATGGVAFIAGTGAIPPPPGLPYRRSVRLDFRTDCGWVFVSDGAKPVAVIEARAPFGMQNPGEPWRWSMSFTPLPAAKD